MSELRRDPILERWVIVAPEREGRPFEPGSGPAGVAAALPTDCPFCPGNEAETPSELTARRDAGSPPDGPGWRVRVVPNRYPALSPREEGDPGADAGVGRHEVIVEAPAHVASWTALRDAALAEVLEVWSERLRAAARDPALRSAVLFKNTGAGAGASRLHVHSQLIALPVVPGAMRAEQALSRRHFDEIGTCAWCALRRDEAHGERVVLQDGGVTLFCPYASRVPGEIWLLPEGHAAHFADVPWDELAGVARAVRRTLLALEAIGATPYNLVLRTAPLQAEPLPTYHWRLEIVPRTTTQGGFEWGSGVYINTLAPEKAAALLRAALA